MSRIDLSCSRLQDSPSCLQSSPAGSRPAPLESVFGPPAPADLASSRRRETILVGSGSPGPAVRGDRPSGRLCGRLPRRIPRMRTLPPVLGAGKLYFSGQNEFLVLSLGTGAVISRAARDSATTHPVRPARGRFLLPRRVPDFDLYCLFDLPRCNDAARFSSLGGTLMSPVIARRLRHGQPGGVSSPSIRRADRCLFQVPTGARQPVAGSVHVRGERAFLHEPKGDPVGAWTLGCARCCGNPVDMPRGRGHLPGPRDLSGVFRLYRRPRSTRSAADGLPLFPPISGASTPPLIAGEAVFGDTGGNPRRGGRGTGKRESTWT